MGRSHSQNSVEICRTSAFYAPPGNFSGSRVLFPLEEAHHIRNVLRLRPGARVEVLDGCGGRFSVLLEGDTPAALEGEVLSRETAAPPVIRIGAALALGRRERMRVAVEKLAELGCSRILPLLTEHVSFTGNAGSQAEKLGKVALGALKQSHGFFLTRVERPLDFARFMEMAASGGISAVFCLKEKKTVSHKTPIQIPVSGEYMLVVGPEGGYSPGEEERIRASGAACIHLGQADLRFETAAVVGFTLLRHWLTGEFVLY